jgi:hypothetical protein
LHGPVFAAFEINLLKWNAGLTLLLDERTGAGEGAGAGEEEGTGILRAVAT